MKSEDSKIALNFSIQLRAYTNSSLEIVGGTNQDE